MLRFAGAAVAGIALVAIAGWLIGWRALATWLPGASPMLVVTALSLMVSGAGLMFISAGWLRVGRMCGVVVLVIGAVELAEHVFDVAFGFDELLVPHLSWVRAGSPPGRMTPHSAAALVLVGLGLAGAASRMRPRFWLTLAGVAVLTILTLPTLGYVVAFTGDEAAYRGMSLPTLLCLLLLALALLHRAAAQRESGEEFLPPALTAALGALLATGVVSVQANAELIDSSRRVVRAHAVQELIERVVGRVARMESTARGYLISGRESLRASSRGHQAELIRLLGQVEALVEDDPVQSRRLKDMRRRALEKIEHNNRMIAAPPVQGDVAALAAFVFAPNSAANNGMIDVGNAIKAEEQRRLSQWERETGHLVQGTRATQAFGSLVAVMLVGLTIAQTRRSAQARASAEAATAAANRSLGQRVAELARARAELEAASRLQRAVLDGTVHAIISTAPDGTITSFNAGAEKMLGYTRAEVVGRATPEIFHAAQEVAARAAEIAAQAGAPGPAGFEAIVARARRGEADEREWTYVRKDGGRVPVSLSVTALHDEAGAITGFLGIAHDLSDRKQAELALKASEERLGRVLSHAECLVWEAGVQLAAADWNWQMTVYPSGLYFRVSGTRQPEKEVGLWYRFVIPEQAEMNRRARDAMERGLGGYVQEFRLLRDGETTWLRETVAITPRGPGQFWLVGVATDITEQKRIEAARAELLGRLEKIGRLVPGMIYQYRQRPDGRASFPYASDGVREIYHVAPDAVREDATPIFAAIHPEDLPAVQQSNHESALAQVAWHREYRVRHPEGGERWVLGRAVPEREPDGSVLWHGFVTDITDRKRLEQSLALARDEALAASRLKSEFLATISHEIRTPMNAVIGMASLLAETPLNAEQAEMARTIVGGAENLLSLINDILDFSRIEAGRLRLDPEDFDLRRVVEETVSLLTPRAHEKQLALRCTFDSAPATLLLGDSGRVRQVLTNLLGNALKFTDQGEVEVRTRVLAETSARTRVRVAVRDTGIGIAPEAQRALFQPFTQVDGSFTRRFGGAGLGLAISRQLVELMDGRIGFHSAPGRGSEFWFELEFPRRGALVPAEPPATPAGVSGAARALPAPPAAIVAGTDAGQPAAPRSGRRLLLAEDNVANQRVAVLLLTKMGYDVTVVENGERALAALAAQPFDAVLMDCQMPVFDGYQATREIRAGRRPGIDPRVPIVALTAYARAEDRARSLEAGMNDHVAKPIRPAELRAALRRCGLDLAGADAPPEPAAGAVTSLTIDPEVFDARALQVARELPGTTGPELLPELIRLYLDEEPVRLARIEQLAQRREAVALADEVHSFGGNAASFGGMQVRRTALGVERAARAGDWAEALWQLERLREAAARLRAEIARLRLADG